MPEPINRWKDFKLLIGKPRPKTEKQLRLCFRPEELKRYPEHVGYSDSSMLLSWLLVYHGAFLDGIDYGIQFSFQNCDLSGLDLSAAGLRKAILTGSTFTNSEAKSVKLQSADLADTNLEYSDFTGADLSEADFTGARLMGVKFSYVYAKRTNFSRAYLMRADMTNAIFDFSNFSGPILTGATFKNTHFFSAIYDRETIWPEGFDPDIAGAEFVDRE